MKDNGGPAFPSNNHPTTQAHEAVLGMTLRDWFAGQALAGMSAIIDERRWPTDASEYEKAAWKTNMLGNDASYCYAISDAMIKERDK